MELSGGIFHILVHLDQYVALAVDALGWWSYALMFLLIFCETGIVIVAFFLPGESLVFAAAAFSAATGLLKPYILVPMFIVAAIGGDSLNYEIGSFLGKRLLAKPNRRIIKDSAIEKTQSYFNKYGGKTIIIARFIPTVRTFAPFIAGMSHMHYPYFLRNNIIGAVLWGCGISALGYYFGTIPFVAEHFGIVLLAVVAVAFVPVAFLFVKNKISAARTKQ